MKTLEVIHLRLAGHDLDSLTELVREAISDAPGPVGVRIYRHARVENDLLVEIHREAEKGPAEASKLGLRVSSLLRRYGLVDHSIWLEVEG
jgi:hypothetical protein